MQANGLGAVTPPVDARDVDRRDHRPLIRAAAVASVLAIVVLAQAGLVLAPSQLDDRPLLVLAIRPTPAFLVMVTNLVPPAAAVLIAAVSRTMVDVAYFSVARYGALPLAQRVGVGRKLSRGLSGRLATRNMLAVTFFWSSTPVVAALGLGSTSTSTFVAVTGMGNIATSGAFVMLGRQYSRYVAPITSWVSAHGTQLTIALGVAVALSAALTVTRSSKFGHRA